MNKKNIFFKQSLVFCLTLLFTMSVCSILAQNNYPTDADAVLMVSQMKARIPSVAQETTKYAAICAIYRYAGMKDSTDLYWDKISINNSQCADVPIANVYTTNDSLVFINSVFTWDFNGIVNISSDGTRSITEAVSSYSTRKPLYNINNIDLSTIGTTITKSNGFVFNHNPISADSIVYTVNSGSGFAKKKVNNYSTGITFTAYELSLIQLTGNGSVLISVYNTMPSTINSKKYYFINNSMAIVGPLTIQ